MVFFSSYKKKGLELKFLVQENWVVTKSVNHKALLKIKIKIKM